MSDDSGSGSTHKQQNKGFMQRLFGTKSRETRQQLAEEEILSLVEEGQEQGVIGNSTKNIIENLFDFDDTVACEIMTHRTEMTAVCDSMELKEVVKIAIDTGHSRIPVYHGDIDSIVGVLYVKDLLRYVCSDVPKNFRLTDITRSVMYVPKTKNCSELFAEMTKRRIQLAIVVDEYGGTEGLLTLEDLVEDILGNIQDEYDHEEDEVKQLCKDKFTVEGTTQIEDAELRLGIHFPQSECDTVAGFMLERLGRIPEDGETPTVGCDGFTLTAAKTEDRRIVTVLIELTPDAH